MKKNGTCGCPCHSSTGVLAALFGLSFLLKNAGFISDSLQNWIWPSIILLAGISKMCSPFCKCCKKDG